MTTRDVLLAEGMRLFGERGYAATSVAQIEAAAGLSPGSGSLYKHFSSKEALLSAGLDRLLGRGQAVADRLGAAGRDAPNGPQDRTELVTSAARGALRRLDEDRDLSRLLFRGLDAFPELLRRFKDEEILRFHQATTALLAGLADDRDPGVDWAAVAVVVQGAAAHYWLLNDLFGAPPSGVDEDRFVAALVKVAVAVLVGPHDSREDPRSKEEK